MPVAMLSTEPVANDTTTGSSSTISILDEVCGPCCPGPSSSHTGAPYHAAYGAQKLLGGPPDLARVTLFNSFAKTFKGHRTDIALAAGLNAIDPSIENTNFRDALSIAADRGMKLHFFPVVDDGEHDNTILLHLERGTSCLEVKIISTGGGRFQIPACRLNGVDIPFFEKQTPGDFALAEEEVKRALPILELAAKVSGNHFYTYAQLARELGVDLAEFALLLETYNQIKKGGLKTLAEVTERAEFILGVMLNAVEQGRRRRQQTSFTSGDWAVLMQKRAWLSGPLSHAFIGAVAAQEYNAGMGYVAFAPTGGASGTLPGTLHFYDRAQRVPRKSLLKALLVAGLIGQVAFLRGPVSGAQVGCGGEIGVASMMSAGAAVYLSGGGFEEMDSAAGLVGQNYVGLDCSPAFGLVEYPCIVRNGFAASQAVLSADMAMSGVRAPYGLDETLTRIFRVGQLLPPTLREREDGHMTETFIRDTCCGRGGCAGCPSAL